MRICGIIAEYNPFHNGHAFQIARSREAGATHVVVLMSGNFVQRGDVAIFSKWARARACLENGADLVVELPTPFAMAPARDFARAGIFLLKELGGELISFGSECGDLNLLKQTAENCRKAEEHPSFYQLIEQGRSFPQALEETLEDLFGSEFSAVVRKPNNLLGLEYLRAIRELNASIEALTIARIGVAHDAPETFGSFASASALRELLGTQGIDAIRPYVPDSAYRGYQEEWEQGHAPCRLEKLDAALCYRLRNITPKELEQTADVTEGLENRILRVGRASSGFADCVDACCTKRYTKARIRRILCSALLGLRGDMFSKQPQYLRVLGLNERGMEVLRSAREHNTIPIHTRFSELSRLGLPQVQFEAKATDIYTLTMPEVPEAGWEFTQQVVVLGKEMRAKG